MKVVHCIAYLTLVLAGSTSGTDSQKPFVQITSSHGQVDRQIHNEQGQDFLSLELEVQSTLPVPVDQIEVEITLLYEGKEIPGWRIQESYSDTELPARGLILLELNRSLAAQRRNLDLRRIKYRIELIRYRLKAIDLETVVKLIESSKSSDQRAALFSLERASNSSREQIRNQNAQDVLRSDFFPRAIKPSPREALRFLVALRIVSSLRLPKLIESILVWYHVQDQKIWGSAIVELVHRINRNSYLKEARLNIIPAWARNSLNHDHRAESTLEDTLFSEITTMDESAVPSLVRILNTSDNLRVKESAQKLLLLMGREDLTKQFALEKPVYLLEMIRLTSQLKFDESIDHLIPLLQSPHDRVRVASNQALLKYGPGVGIKLAMHIAEVPFFGKTAARDLLHNLVRTRPSIRSKLSQRFGLLDDRKDTSIKFTEKVIKKARTELQRQVEFEIEKAFESLQRKEYQAAFAQLDQIYAKNPILYMKSASRISKAYQDYGKILYDSGNFDFAKSTLLNALQVKDDQEVRELLALIKLALAEGYLQLGQFDKALYELKRIEPPARELARYDALRVTIHSASAQQALAVGDHVRARLQLDRALGIDPSAPGLKRKYAIVFAYENLVPLGVLMGFLSAGLVAMGIRVRHRFTRKKFVRIQSQIDEGSSVFGGE